MPKVSGSILCQRATHSRLLSPQANTVLPVPVQKKRGREVALEKRDLLHAEPQKLLLAHPGQAVRRCVAVEHMPVAVQGDQALVQLIQDGRPYGVFPAGSRRAPQ